MTIDQDRETTRRRLGHLEYISHLSPDFNLRSLMGAQSVFQLLDFSTYRQLAWASSQLQPGTNLFVTRDSSSKVQERELHVALSGPGDERGRVEFEFERSLSYWKFEVDLKIRNADAGSSHDFFIDGQRLGTVVVNALGKGRLEFSTDPSTGELPFPGGIPEVHLGSKIQVGSILEASVGGFNDSTDNSIRPGEVEFDMFGSGGVRGDVKLEHDPEDNGLKTEFRVRIRDTSPNQTLNVFVDEINVGQIVVDEDGRGILEFSTDPNFDESPFPPGFPEIQVGSQVRIGSLLNGTFGQLPNLGPNGHGDSSDIAEFQGGLFGGSAAHGGSRYEIELEDGGFLEHKFRVHVKNAVPGSTHSIFVDGTDIGEITIGDDGRGKVDFSNRMHDIRDLSLPDYFPEVHQGTEVRVGDILQGTLRDISPQGFAVRPDSLRLGQLGQPANPGIGLTSGGF